MSKSKGIQQDMLKVRFLKPEDKISRRELLKLVLPHSKTVPFGKVELDSSQCTGCGLCALNCPTEALTASFSEEGGYQLLFRHDLCVACGRCIEVCPEKCLRVERILELDSIDSPAAILFEDRIVRCRECGSIIGSRAMIDKLQVKLMAIGDSFTSQLELCPVCKSKQLLVGWR